MDGRLRRAARNQSGYTLTELITVATIVGIIASIAVPFFLGQRQSSWRSAAASDVRSTAMVVETVATDHQLPAALVNTSAGVQLLGEDQQALPMAIAARSSGVRLAYHRADNEQRYCLCGYHEGLGDEPAAVYDSGAGGFVDQCVLDDEPAPCDGAPEAIIAGGIPVTFAGVLASGAGFVRAPGAHWAQGMVDGPLITDGTLRLTGASADHRHESYGGGWALAYGAFGGSNNELSSGYTVQFDRHLDAFLIRSFNVVDGNNNGTQRDRQELRVDRTSIDALAGTDPSWWTQAHDVQLEVAGGALHLTVDGSSVLSYEMNAELEGTFGIRTWHETHLSYNEATLLVD